MIPNLIGKNRLIQPDDPSVARLTPFLLRDTPIETAKAACEWVHRTIAYKPELRTDIWQPPSITLLGTGDCEDMSLLLASILLKMKIPVKLTYGLLEGRPHVWVETIPEGKYVFEPTSGEIIPWEKRFDEGYLELAYISPTSIYPQPANPIGVLGFVMSQVNRVLEKVISGGG